MTDKSAVLVPREPTEAILDAGVSALREHTDVYFDGSEVVHETAVPAIYAAMIAAAPVLPPSVVDEDVREIIQQLICDVLLDGQRGDAPSGLARREPATDAILALIASSLTGEG